MAGRRAVILLSGGLDSATTLAIARGEGFDTYALSFDYGQRHDRELDSARRVAAALGAREHLVLRLDLRAIGGSALTADIPVPKGRSVEAMGSGIPVTYVPARNTIFLAFAVGLAEVEGASAIVIGANALDYSGYPDCRPEFLGAFETVARLGTKAGAEGKPLRILAPLVELSKADIVRLADRLGAPIQHSWSCYRGGTRPCGTCESCVLRRKGFEQAGLKDPVQGGR